MKYIWLLCGASLLAGCNKKVSTHIWDPEQQRAVDAAQALFKQKKADGVAMSRGPCLGEIMPGWVADVVHNPRQPIDEDPANQCRDFLKGKAKHLVELDTDGNVVRIK